MERNRSGLRKIYGVYKEMNFKKPELNDHHDYFLITLFDLLGEKKDRVILTGAYDEMILFFSTVSPVRGRRYRNISVARAGAISPTTSLNRCWRPEP